MSLLQAVLMGLLQGLTEFLPVSSSGHLALFQLLFGVETDTGMLFPVLLHVGTLFAICAVYYRDLGRLMAGAGGVLRDCLVNIGIFFRNRVQHAGEPYLHPVSNGYRKFAMLLLVSTVPTGIIGIFGRHVAALASEILIVPGICLVVTAALLLVADHLPEGGRLPKSVSYTSAFFIGIAQGIATLPGISRSGTTVTACLAYGCQRSFAVKYSFLMSIPAILGALALELADLSYMAVSPAEIVCYIVGMLVAAAVGYISIKLMVLIVRKKKLIVFAVYCLLVGLLSIGGYFYMA